jgi:hypothetical protein
LLRAWGIRSGSALPDIDRGQPQETTPTLCGSPSPVQQANDVTQSPGATVCRAVLRLGSRNPAIAPGAGAGLYGWLGVVCATRRRAHALRWYFVCTRTHSMSTGRWNGRQAGPSVFRRLPPENDRCGRAGRFGLVEEGLVRAGRRTWAWRVRLGCEGCLWAWVPEPRSRVNARLHTDAPESPGWSSARCAREALSLESVGLAGGSGSRNACTVSSGLKFHTSPASGRGRPG